MTTAFQSNAYQNNAFQIDVSTGDTHDGVDEHVKRFYASKRAASIKKIYENLPKNDRKVIAAVDAYLPLTTPERVELRQQAKYVVNELPSFDEINLYYIMQNYLAQQRFLAAIGYNLDDELLFLLASIA
ncbi:MAG: hypothetical protein EBZ49_07825 [Proteobacteria bacterium]|nr:hypothetical protein [Pseudomonadota bacterium]